LAGCCSGSACHTKKDLQALEQKRRDVAELRHIWIAKRQPFMANHLERLAFIDETSIKTNMAKTTGWAPRGQRLIDHAPFGHWHTQTFIAALRHDRLDAPWVIDGPINRDGTPTCRAPMSRPRRLRPACACCRRMWHDRGPEDFARASPEDAEAADPPAGI
jgi:hypothetical protein